MSAEASAARARALLAERMAEAPAAAARVPATFAALGGGASPRVWITTGIGTSEGHARHLAEVAARFGEQPARFMPTAALMGGPPPDAERDGLVVFSQGLSANARFALADPGAWARAVLLTGLPHPESPEFAQVPAEKAEWLLAFARQGGIQIDLGCGSEYGLLVRVIGARTGFAAAWSFVRTLRRAQLRSEGALAQAPTPAEGADAQRRAADRGAALFENPAAWATFFAPDRPLVVVAEYGHHAWADHLALKVAEGMYRPAPRLLDVLEWTHGPLQSLADRPASILYLAGPGPKGEARPAGPSGGFVPSDLQARFERTLDPALHTLRVVNAEAAAPFAMLEYEAAFDAMIWGGLAASGLDLSVWPSQEREDALYGLGPDFSAAAIVRAETTRQSTGPRGLAAAVWPEVESALASGCRTALVPLGSVEQHGPHLPMGTDAWIAEALGQGLAARRRDVWALPAVSLGIAPEHLSFPGTLSLSPSTLEAILRDLLAALAMHGFERAFLFSAHGGNVAALEEMGPRLAEQTSLSVAVETDLAGLTRMQAEAAESFGLSPEAAGPHAGEFETSLMAYLRPGTVRTEALEAGVLEPGEVAQTLFDPDLRPNAPTGVVGDPTRAEAERGRVYFERWLDRLEAALDRAF